LSRVCRRIAGPADGTLWQLRLRRVPNSDEITGAHGRTSGWRFPSDRAESGSRRVVFGEVLKTAPMSRTAGNPLAFRGAAPFTRKQELNPDATSTPGSVNGRNDLPTIGTEKCRATSSARPKRPLRISTALHRLKMRKFVAPPASPSHYRDHPTSRPTNAPATPTRVTGWTLSRYSSIACLASATRSGGRTVGQAQHAGAEDLGVDEFKPLRLAAAFEQVLAAADDDRVNHQP